jgi:DNA polymerase V
MFALVDCNNFYASCERVFHPEWKNRPIVILSNNDGCIIARSNEAKALGIPMGAPLFQYKDLMKAHNVIICSSNYTLYGEMSARVMQTLKTFSAETQIYSIDEAFLALQGEDLEDQALKIREKVLKWTGIPVSIGIAKTKTLAKVANYYVKQNKTSCGVFILEGKSQIDHILDTLPVTDIWGIGGRLGKKLSILGISTAQQFRDADDTLIKKHLSVVGLRTAMELREINCLPLNEVPSAKKSITCSRAFGRPIETFEELCEAVASYTAKAAEKMRSQGSVSAEMNVFVEFHPFQRDIPNSLYSKIVFPEPTNYTPHLIAYAKTVLKQLYQPGKQYRKAGIILESLVSEHCFQTDLFAKKEKSNKKLNKLMGIIDTLNDGFGHNIVHSAAEGVSSGWKMKQNRRTARFTTRWNELLTIKI